MLDEIDKNVSIEPIENKFQATTLLNDNEISCVAPTRTKARACLILKVMTEIETLENEISVEKPKTVKIEDSDDESKASLSSLVISVEDSEEDNQDCEIIPSLQFYKKRALDFLRSERLRRRRDKGLFISPKGILSDVLGHIQVNVVSYNKLDSFDHRVTVDFCGELVEGSGKKYFYFVFIFFLFSFCIKGYNEHVAEQDACRLVFTNILKIDWDREVKGLI